MYTKSVCSWGFAYDIGSIKITDVTGKYGEIKKFNSSFSDIIGKLGGDSAISIQIPEITMPDLSGINSISIQVA